MIEKLGQIKPQVLIVIVILGVIALYALRISNPEVASGAVGGVIAMGTRLLEHN